MNLLKPFEKILVDTLVEDMDIVNELLFTGLSSVRSGVDAVIALLEFSPQTLGFWFLTAFILQIEFTIKNNSVIIKKKWLKIYTIQ